MSFTLWKASRNIKAGQNAHADVHHFDQLFVNCMFIFIVETLPIIFFVIVIIIAINN